MDVTSNDVFKRAVTNISVDVEKKFFNSKMFR